MQGLGAVGRGFAFRRFILADIPPLAAALFAALAVSVPTAVRWLIDRGESGVPFVSYFPVLVLAALFLGWRWAAAVALASGVIANRLFRDEPLLFWAGTQDAVLVGLFFLSCIVLIWAADFARRTVRALEEAKSREEVLNRELLHRVKNMMATVSAMAVLTARHSAAEEFPKALAGRLEALQRATGLLDMNGSASCDMHKLVDAALAPFRAGCNFEAAGPPCELPRDACVPLSLALHELCTNASKYGALSAPEGRVTLLWTVGEGEDGLLRVSWREEGGPPVTPPARRGMGSQLLSPQKGLNEVMLAFPPEGARCEIDIAGVVAAE
jgi:two-component sensor histidine kinase